MRPAPTKERLGTLEISLQASLLREPRAWSHRCVAVARRATTTYFGVIAIGRPRCHSRSMSTGELLVMAYLCIMLITSGIGRGKRHPSSHMRRPTLSHR
jgi:hypothetical protein